MSKISGSLDIIRRNLPHTQQGMAGATLKRESSCECSTRQKHSDFQQLRSKARMARREYRPTDSMKEGRSEVSSADLADLECTSSIDP